MPTIKIIYQSFESGGNSKDEIVARLKNLKFDTEVRTGVKSFYQTAQDLRNMDEARNSWTNEDPNWQDVASSLDSANMPPGYPPSNLAMMAFSAPPAVGFNTMSAPQVASSFLFGVVS